MPLDTIGPVGYHQVSAAATLAFTPQYDRAAYIRRILIDKVSAGDVWVVSVQGREVARYDIQTTGNQQPLAGPYSNFPKNSDLFRVYNTQFPDRLVYPVPLGQTFTVTSVGGATANISFEFVEVTPAELNTGMVNHPQGNRIICPLVGYRNANVTVLGENTLDTQIGPSWFPNIFVDGILPPNWQIRVLGMFLEGGGVNTFSGAADHRSVTSYFAVYKNGQRLYTRDIAGGLPLIGQASAAGSANVVVGTDETPYPPFQEMDVEDWVMFSEPLILGGGDQYQFRLNITGDVTGGAAYASIRQFFLCDVRNPGTMS